MEDPGGLQSMGSQLVAVLMVVLIFCCHPGNTRGGLD